MVLSCVPRRQVAEPLHSTFVLPDPTPLPQHNWDLRALSALQQFFQEWTEPTLLLGMGVGHIGWEAGRLLGFSGAVSGGLTARAALWAARTGGILVEGATWAAAAQAGRLLGTKSPSDPNFSQFGREWAENSLFSGVLRSAQQGFRKAGPWGAMLGSYTGLVLSQQAISVARFHQVLPWGEALGHSAGLFVNFYVGGSMARSLWGSSLAGMEQLFRQKFIRASHLTENPRGYPPNIGWGGRAYAATGPAGASGQDLPANCWAIGGDPDGFSGKPRRPLSSHPERREVREVVEETGTYHRPWQTANMDRLLREMKNPLSRFQEKILQEHVFYLLRSREAYSIPEMTQALNKLLFLRDIPGGRRIQLQFADDPAVVHNFIKLAAEFHFREKGRNTPPEHKVSSSIPPASATYSQTTAALQVVQSQMDRVAQRFPPSHPANLRPHTVVPARIVDIPASRPTLRMGSPANPEPNVPPSPLKLVANNHELNALLMALATNDKATFVHEVLFNAKHSLKPTEILLARDLIQGSVEGSRISLHDPHPRRSYSFFKEGRVVGASTPWSPPNNFGHFEIQNLLELIQKLSFIRSTAPLRGVMFVDIRGQWRPWHDGGELEKFLNAQVPGPQAAIQIRQGANTQTFRYEPAKGLWVMGPWQ